MLIDITLKLTGEILDDKRIRDNKALVGHTGTHFDAMDKEFPLEYTERKGIVFDVRGVKDRDIDAADIDLDLVEPDMFVAFFSGYIEEEGYLGDNYFKAHPQLTHGLIDTLLDKGVSIIGLDFAGIRRGKEHVPKDRQCADRGAFVIENLCGLGRLLELGGRFTACTYPLRCEGMTGLPCRVVAKL